MARSRNRRELMLTSQDHYRAHRQIYKSTVQIVVSNIPIG
jgi:hypothetical protein